MPTHREREGRPCSERMGSEMAEFLAPELGSKYVRVRAGAIPTVIADARRDSDAAIKNSGPQAAYCR